MKNICLPVISRSQEKIMLKYENTPIAFVLYNTADFQGENKICKKIGVYYSKLTESFAKWVNRDFQKYAQSDYISDTNPRKRFRYVPFSLNYDMSANINNSQYLQVNINISLCKKKNKISERNLRHIWNLKTGTLQIAKK